ncbi:homer protein homolog 2-like [Littorina saxatilis]|uniref:homer protein homolog 2-like n=1 Tax=Littorina saxatilis TaxID=31220 RepID=UPI0038B43BA1
MSVGEQPIFSTKAHVFQIDPETKKNWISSSKVAVNVSYYYDSTRNTYRIISVDGSKAIINSTITPAMTFTKTSQKFGQWSDPRANTVYGLGFTTEGELAKFIDKFKEIKDLTRRSVAASPKPTAEINGAMEVPGSPQTAPARPALHQRTSSLSSIPTDNTNLRERRNSFTQGSNGVNNTSSSNPSEGQLKYENDRLKLALAQSSANAKKWEVELTTLKNNNARLTAALQESTANVEEWKKQLATYKEENARLRKKASDKDHEGGANSKLLQQELHALNEETSRLRQSNNSQQQEIVQLSKQLEDASLRDTQASTHQRRIQDLEEENHCMSVKVQDLQRQLQDSRAGRESESREILSLQETLGSKITEMYDLHEQIISSIRKESHS